MPMFDTIDATEELKQEIAKKVLGHVSEACGALCGADAEVAVAEERVVRAVELAKTYGFTCETLVERLKRDSDDPYIDGNLFAQVFNNKHNH